MWGKIDPDQRCVPRSNSGSGPSGVDLQGQTGREPVETVKHLLGGRHFNALQGGGGFVGAACEYHYVNVVVLCTCATTVGFPTNLLAERVLDR